MIALFKDILKQTMERISAHFITYAPRLLAAIFIVLIAYVIAKLVRWLISRIFKATAFDRFLRRSGLSTAFGHSGRMRPVEIVAGTAYWVILLVGLVSGISAFDTQITTQITQTIVFLSPKMLAAGVILVIGSWLGQYLARHLLVWSVNEGIPAGRRLAQALRILVVFVAAAAAADYLGFARNVFLAAFILVVGGIVLAASIALGSYGKEILHRWLQEKPDPGQEKEDMPVWRHL